MRRLATRIGKSGWAAITRLRHSTLMARIYFLSEEGESVVIAPGKEFKALATNQLDGQTLASMAVSSGSIFVRSQTHLYRLSNESAEQQKGRQ
jgi:hypothetical protein